MDPTHHRIDYTSGTLDDAEASADPIEQFRLWFADAGRVVERDPNAMTLATVGADGRPSVRIVLLRGYGDDGFVFFTNYESRKGREIEANPHASLLLFWAALERQIRIEGTVSRVSEEESDAYFSLRPLGNRLGAWASPQSREIPDRQFLAARVDEFEARYGAAPPRPQNWGGYRLRPESIEFWQGRADRLHDRLLYRRGTSGWARVRLAP
ncbi:MAG: pyridoxamine 5'-phosphate oxidase [Gammaproteobacteria bacterium]|nr:pyridoxamine 5'-phosphate oxidase [Gammaproteobacteria bacterium]MBU0771669.1 pyridoxamine 5'-phosphate oxidase [Gammaproteobacteria bacterium]MBU0856942.1 pyridoxamine 5'-phosphate oxidase [Gammaproteobacteria bacterium]MBU1848243.1 pyridoxamine 5'-phosphate oxidase [Gammaproteobacteria bacterium]